ncbi:14365_t:CDS:2, partial [Funneliformis geosporum]
GHVVTTNESQVSTNTANKTSTGLETSLLPLTSDFRTSLILPTLTKRFSVLRRGENANNNNGTSTKTSSNTQGSPPEIYKSQAPQRSLLSENTTTTNEVSKIESGNENHELLSNNSSSVTLTIKDKNDNSNNQEVMTNARKFYDPPSRIHDDDENEIINTDIVDVKNLRRISSNGLLINPTKDRPKLPRIRPPSISQIQQWQNEFTTISNASSLSLPNFVQSTQQISPTKNSPTRLSPRETNSYDNNDEIFLQQPRSPLDKLSEGLYNLTIQSSPNISPTSPSLSTNNLSQTSLRSLEISPFNEREEIKSSIHKSPSINSLRNFENEKIYNSDRESTTSTIGSSLKRIRIVLVDVRQPGIRESTTSSMTNTTNTTILSNTTNTTNISSTSTSNITTESQVKDPFRGKVTPPPKPHPPPLSLTDTLIASGQSDIAHQNAGIKNISGPQLVSTSSNVKTIPIVQLGQIDDGNKVRRKFSLRESETGIGKSLRRIKDVFISDNESLFGKKRMSPNSSNENLSRKFASDESLNQRFTNNEKRGFDFVKRRAFSTRENNKPNDKLKQDIKNDFTFIIDYEQNKQSNGDDNINIENTNISSDRLSTPVNDHNKWTGQPPLYDIDALKRHAEKITRYSNNKKVDYPIISSRPSSQSDHSGSGSLRNSSSSLSLIVDLPNGSESVPSSPISTYSPISTMSPLSDIPSGRSTPPQISPRNPLRQSDKNRVKYSFGSQNSTSDVGSDDKRDSKDSRASSSSRFIRLKNKVIRRTIIITKPYLPLLPEDPSSTSTSPSFPIPKSSLKKKKVDVEDGKIYVASDGRQWFLSKNTSNDDEKEKEEIEIKNENVDDSKLLSVSISRTSLSDRPPTPIPSPNTRESAIDLPYGIPIPPIPSPYRNSVISKGSKRTSKSSIASSLKSSSSKFNRKSIGSKSIYSSYGESLYDYYYYSDQEGADDENDNSSNNLNTKRKQLESQHVEVLEMSDGSYVWQVVNGLRGDDMEDRYSYYYGGANTDNDDDYLTNSQIWPQDFGRLNYGDLEDDQVSQLSFNDDNNESIYGHLDYYTADYPSPLHLPGVEPLSKQNQYLTPDRIPSSRSRSPDRLINEEYSYSNASSISSKDEKFIPRTSVYFAKDVPLPKLLEEMTRGLESVDLDREENHYVYGGEINAGGTGVVGGMTVEEKLERVMRALGVDDRDVYVDE